LIVVATVGFSQKQDSPAPTIEIPAKDALPIWKLEAEMLKAEMNGDSSEVEKVYDYDNDWTTPAPSRPDWNKAALLKAIREHEGDPTPYIATQEGMHIYMLGDTAVAMYVKKYVVKENPSIFDIQDQTDVFVKGGNAWKLRISRSSPHEKK